MYDFKLKLLEPLLDADLPDVERFIIGGRTWVLKEYSNPMDAPPFSTISYAWGNVDKNLVSLRTIPVLETAIKISQNPESWEGLRCGDEARNLQEKEGALKASNAFWIDALCVPYSKNINNEYLNYLGEIYGLAHQTFVVLSESSADVFNVIRADGKLDETALDVLESDEWLDRAWVYQEAVNSQALYFVAQNTENTLMPALVFLNYVLTATTDYKERHMIDPFVWSEKYSGLDRLENLIADFRLSEFAERSAYQVMSAVHQRSSSRPKDEIMAGAMPLSTQIKSDNKNSNSQQNFVRNSEEVGDYSFIYCTSPRCKIEGQRWRPESIEYPPVLSGLLVSGKTLKGSANPRCLKLENMCRLEPRSIGVDGIKAVKSFIQGGVVGDTSDDIAAAALKAIKRKGFSGTGRYIELENGYFFPQSEMTISNDMFIGVSPVLKWVNGAPGLLLSSDGSDLYEFCDVGVFVGRVPQKGVPINIG